MTYFKVTCGYECGGPEDGMMCKLGDYIVQAPTAQEALNTVWNYERENPEFMGCSATPATAEEIKDWFDFTYGPLPF